MKKFIVFFLVFSFLCLIVSCGNLSENDTDLSKSEQSTDFETTTAPWGGSFDTCGKEQKEVADLFRTCGIQLKEVLPSGNTEATTIFPYRETLYTEIDGIHFDNRFMFMTPQSMIIFCRDEIPTIRMTVDSDVVLSASNGMTATLGKTLYLYDEDGKSIDEVSSFSELYERGTTEWQDLAVYVYFHVRLENASLKSVCVEGCFVKVDFRLRADINDFYKGPSVGIEGTLASRMNVYQAMEYMKIYDGSNWAIHDGEPMFFSIPSVIEKRVREIPVIPLEKNSSVCMDSPSDNIPVSGAETFLLYDETFTQIGTANSLEEVRTIAAGRYKPLYVAFHVKLYVEDCGDRSDLCIFRAASKTD